MMVSRILKPGGICLGIRRIILMAISSIWLLFWYHLFKNRRGLQLTEIGPAHDNSPRVVFQLSTKGKEIWN
jgi:hypothetical protein